MTLSSTTKKARNRTNRKAKNAEEEAKAKIAPTQGATETEAVQEVDDMGALAKSKTMVDKRAEDDGVVADINGGSEAVPICERLAQIRVELGCSLGEARHLLWRDKWAEEPSVRKEGKANARQTRLAGPFRGRQVCR
jgi:hypothetical protein